jgi:hypothetical protein
MKQLIGILLLFTATLSQAQTYLVTSVNGTPADNTGDVTVTSGATISKNATRDSIVLIDGFGNRSAAKDSIGGSATIVNGSTQISGSLSDNMPYDSSGFIRFTSAFRWDRVNTVLECSNTIRAQNHIFGKNGLYIGTTTSNPGFINTAGAFIGYKGFGSNNTIIKFGYSAENDANAQIVLMRASNTDASIGFGGMDGANSSAQGQYRCHNTSGAAIRSVTGTLLFYGNSGLIAGNVATLTERLRIQNDGTVSINNSSPSTKAILDVASTTQGFLPPRMTEAQRDAITSPPAGLTIYCTDCTAGDASTGVAQTYNGTSWKSFW